MELIQVINMLTFMTLMGLALVAVLFIGLVKLKANAENELVDLSNQLTEKDTEIKALRAKIDKLEKQNCKIDAQLYATDRALSDIYARRM